MLLVGGLQVLLGGRTRILFLIGVRQPAVRAVGGFLHLVLRVGVPITIFGQQCREAVFHAVLHLAPDVLLVLVADLIAADVAERRVIRHFGSVAPFETRETFVDDYARNVARTVGQPCAVAAVCAVGIGHHVHGVAVDVAHEQRVFADTVCVRADCVPFVDRRDRTFAYGELDLFECHVGVDVVVGQLVHVFLLDGNVGGRTGGARNDHRLGDALQFVAVGILDQVAGGALNEELHVVVLVEDVVLDLVGENRDAVAAVLRFEVEGPFRNGVVDCRGGKLGVLARIAVVGVAHDDAFDDDVVFDLLVEGVVLAELLESDVAAERLFGRALQQIELDGDGLVPPVGE